MIAIPSFFAVVVEAVVEVGRMADPAVVANLGGNHRRPVASPAASQVGRAVADTSSKAGNKHKFHQ